MEFSNTEIELIKNSEYFDEEWYSANYPDVKKNAALHYLAVGWLSGRNPGPKFDGITYSLNNPVVSINHINPLLHYEKSGKLLGVNVQMTSGEIIRLLDVSKQKNCWQICAAVKKDYNIHIVVNNCEVKPETKLSFDQQCFNEYLDHSDEKLLIFNILSLGNKSNRIIFVDTATKVKLTVRIDNFVNMYQLSKNGYYVIAEDNIVSVVDRTEFEAYTERETAASETERALLNKVKAISENDRIYSLYIETLDNHNDNAFNLFCYDYYELHNENAYFVTSKINYEHETDEKLKSHYIILNSQSYKDMLCYAKRIVVSWWCFPSYGYDRSRYLYPYLNYEFYFVPHGISYDKDSYYLHYCNFGKTNSVYCCSEYEKNYFEKCNGISNVKVLGYPRLDKWSKGETEKNSVFIFPTWRKDVEDGYISELVRIAESISNNLEGFKIVYAAHPSIKTEDYQVIEERLKTINADIICIDSLDGESFNKYFASCEYLITDYSSVAYDFSYREDAWAIYYTPLAEINMQYNLRPEFYEGNCGITVKSIDELMTVLNGDFITENIIERKKKFFKYRDSNNTGRVFEDIMKGENHK